MKRIDVVLEQIRAKRINRSFAVRADDEDWVTINGTHVLLGEEGEALSGGKLKGKKFAGAKSTKKPAKAPNGQSTGSKLKVGKNSIKFPIEYFRYAGPSEIKIDGKTWWYMKEEKLFFNYETREELSFDKYREKYGDEIEIIPFESNTPTYNDLMKEITARADPNAERQLESAESELIRAQRKLERAEKRYSENPSDEYNKTWLADSREDVKKSEEALNKVQAKWNETSEYLRAVIQAYEATGHSAMRPDDFIGNKLGKEMSHKEADNGKVNPNYDPDSDEYSRNCQTCVVAYEARLRGYNVHAGAYKVPSPLYELAKSSYKAWINPVTGRAPEPMRPKTEVALLNGHTYATWLSSKMETGGRYNISVAWKGTNCGHVVSCHKTKDFIAIYDPQTNTTYTSFDDVTQYLSRVEPNSLSMVRVDNMMMNPFVLEGCFAKDEPKNGAGENHEQ